MELLKSLLQVKKIIALLITIVFCILSIIGTITGTEFIVIFTSIIGFYFGQSSVRSTIQESKKDVE